MYYLDRQWYDKFYDTYFSYEGLAYDNKYFNTREEAEKYAKEIEWLLGENEIFQIMETEEE